MLGAQAFENCYNLESITVPNSLKSIGYAAFSRNFALKSFTFPASLQSIEGRTFQLCSNLTELDVSRLAQSVTNSTVWKYVFYEQADQDRVTKIICLREQTEKIQSTFANATLEFVD